MAQQVRSEMPTAANSHNFNVVTDTKTQVGSTLDNLKAAVTGETGATTKYSAFAAAAKSAGYDQISRLFEATAAAEKLHIAMETKLVQAEEPDFQGPTATAPAPESTDLDLIGSANGEIYETSDMYPAFIKKAQEEGNNAAVQVFTRAKLAEAYHAQRYIDAYNNIDNPSDEKYYLCPICGYIHKGDDFEKCPICFAQKSAFRAF